MTKIDPELEELLIDNTPEAKQRISEIEINVKKTLSVIRASDLEIRIEKRTYKLAPSIGGERYNVIEVGGGVRGVIVFHEYVDKSKGGEYWGGLGIHRPRRDKRYLSKEIGPVFLAICQAEEERKVKGRHYRY